MTSRFGAGQALAYLSPQSPGSDCRDGLLHCSDDHLQRALLLLRHQSRSSAHPVLQRHKASDKLVDVQQLREALPFGSAPRFVIFDRDAKYGLEVPAAVRSLSVSPVRTSFASPSQNGVAERWVGSCRRNLLDHISAVDERHLKRRPYEYIRYYHEDRTHLGLGKGTPDGRTRTIASGHVLSHVRLGGLHHRYDRAA
jgi:putative transposase